MTPVAGCIAEDPCQEEALVLFYLKIAIEDPVNIRPAGRGLAVSDGNGRAENSLRRVDLGRYLISRFGFHWGFRLRCIARTDSRIELHDSTEIAALRTPTLPESHHSTNIVEGRRSRPSISLWRGISCVVACARARSTMLNHDIKMKSIFSDGRHGLRL